MLNLGLGLWRRKGGVSVPIAPFLSGFVDDLDQDPPALFFDSSQAGTATWDFHASAAPPGSGLGDIGTGTYAVEAGANDDSIDLSAFAGSTGYVHIRVANGNGVSNILTSQEITVPGAVELMPDPEMNGDGSEWTTNADNSVVYSGGLGTFTNVAGTGSGRNISIALTTAISTTYSLAFGYGSGNGASKVRVGTSAGALDILEFDPSSTASPQSFAATTTTTYITIRTGGTAGNSLTLSSLSVQEQ